MLTHCCCKQDAALGRYKYFTFFWPVWIRTGVPFHLPDGRMTGGMAKEGVFFPFLSKLSDY